MNETPKFSNSWDEPCLTRSEEDGSKIEWYERDLSDEALIVVEKILKSIAERNEINAKFEQAKIIVQSVVNMDELQVMLLDKLVSLSPGKKIITGQGEMQMTKNVKPKIEEVKK
tara:strand:- start:741 stop:1082 length:342 start_codon:yes stop_codon:yes gene_type:complete